jgi:hypothetical protein
VKAKLDLHLWLDQALVQRQNQLKTDFLDLFEQLGNAVTTQELTCFFSNSKGKKISKGNQLLGFPYLVLDLIRDFDLDSGCNIRFVSWFGHGLYCCVFLGKTQLLPKQLFIENGFQMGRNDLPWDLAAQVDWMQTQTDDSRNLPKQEGGSLWIKEIAMVEDREICFQILRKELRKILQAKGKESLKK